MQVTAGTFRREMHVVGLISAAHLLSHVYMLALVPLYKQITEALGIGFTEIGIAATVFAGVTGSCQTPVGFLVDRIGGRKVLAGGLLVNAAAIGAVGLVTSYWQLLVVMAVGGVGCSVFHPADYSILSATVEEKRLGRIFSIHTLGGQIGAAAAAPVVIALAALSDWRTALMIIGAIGVVLSVVIFVLSNLIGAGGHARKKKEKSGVSAWRTLAASRPIVLFFIFYVGSSAANAGIVQFAVTAYSDIYGLPVAVTAITLTVYQLFAMLAVLPGGVLADRVAAPEMVLAACFGGAAVLVVIAGIGILPFWLAVVVLAAAGGLRGLVNASRDVSVRHAAGSGISIATVFAFVSTGFSMGQMTGPTIYGWLIDIGSPQVIFWVSAGFSLMSVSTIFIGRLTRPRVAAAE